MISKDNDMCMDNMIEIEVKSSIDGSIEKNLLYVPECCNGIPLTIGLHTWSYDRFNQVESMLPLCRDRKWALLLPEFRGTNCDTNPRAHEACGSTLAKQDVIDACDFVCENYPVDKNAIFINGGSGGGHMALMVAAYAPEKWLAVSSWCPITNLSKWHGQNQNYMRHIEACCGGAPGDSKTIDAEYTLRSPISVVKEIAKAKVCIWHGRGDTSVPYTHTMELATQLEELKANFFFSIFDGTHEIRHKTAFEWFDRICNSKEIKKTELTG